MLTNIIRKSSSELIKAYSINFGLFANFNKVPKRFMFKVAQSAFRSRSARKIGLKIVTSSVIGVTGGIATGVTSAYMSNKAPGGFIILLCGLGFIWACRENNVPARQILIVMVQKIVLALLYVLLATVITLASFLGAAVCLQYFLHGSPFTLQTLSTLLHDQTTLNALYAFAVGASLFSIYDFDKE